MDLGTFGHIEFTWAFFYALLSIVLIDLVLAGDNAVVIAMAVKSLPKRKRLLGIAVGAGGAVVIRVAATFVCSQLLLVQWVKLVGGAVILWIAVKLLVEGAEEEGERREAKSLLQALYIIVIADITMSVDNMLAVAAASHGNLFLLLFGLGLSIPFVVFTSSLLSTLMDRYPIILYIGAAVLGRVGGEMMITDPWIVRVLDPSKGLKYGVEIFFTVGVIVCARVILKQKAQKIRAAHGVPERV